MLLSIGLMLSDASKTFSVKGIFKIITINVNFKGI